MQQQVTEEALHLSMQLASHDSHVLQLQDQAYADPDNERLQAKLARAVSAGTRMSAQLQVLRSEGEVARRVQAELARRRSRQRLDDYLATKEV